MKKVVFSLIAVSLLATTIISCQSNQKETTDSSGADSNATVNSIDTAKVTKDSIGGGNNLLAVSPDVVVKAPQFSSEDVNEVLGKFEPIKQEYIAAIKSKDANQIKAVTAKYYEWVKVAATGGSKLSKDENQSYIDHYTKLNAQWDKLSQRIKK